MIAADSFSRRNKPQSCDPSRLQGGLHRKVLSWRIAEAKHAYDWVVAQPWADPDRIFLGGYSEGGQTTANYCHGGLAGRFILSWSCHHNWAEYHGIAGPQSEPIFAAIASRDPWVMKKSSYAGNCGEALSGHPRSLNIIVDWDRHPIAFHDDVEPRLLDWLKSNSKSK